MKMKMKIDEDDHDDHDDHGDHDDDDDDDDDSILCSLFQTTCSLFLGTAHSVHLRAVCTCPK